MDQLFDLVIYFYWGLSIFVIICFVFVAIFFKIFLSEREYDVAPISADSDELDSLKKRYSTLLRAPREDYDPKEERDPREEYPETVVSPIQESTPSSSSDDDYPPPRKVFCSYWHP